MKTYKEFLKLYEGGNAIKISTPITEEELIYIQNWLRDGLLKKLDLKEEIDFSFKVGSSNKKKKNDTYGDVDVLILLTPLLNKLNTDIDNIFTVFEDYLIKTYKLNKDEIAISKGFSQISIGIKTNLDNIAQIDLMMVPNLDFAKFLNYSPNFKENESLYKGIHRNVLLSTYLNTKKVENIEKTEDGKLKQITKYYISLKNGLSKHTKDYVSEKTGAIIKTGKIIDNEFISFDVDEISNLLFPDLNISLRDYMTFEKLWNLISIELPKKNIITKEEVETIKERLKKALEKQQLPVPKEIDY